MSDILLHGLFMSRSMIKHMVWALRTGKTSTLDFNSAQPQCVLAKSDKSNFCALYGLSKAFFM